jgi:hypothetical protein
MVIADVIRQKTRWGTGVALAGVILALASSARAQSVGTSGAEPARSEVRDGLKVWVTTTDGHQERGTMLSFTPSKLVLRIAGSDVAIPFAEVQRIERTDPLDNGMRNGAIVGALVALPASIGLARSGDSCHGCGVLAVIATLVNTSIGASIGAWIDHLIVDRRLVYSASSGAPARPPAVIISPIVSARRLGAGASIRW